MSCGIFLCHRRFGPVYLPCDRSRRLSEATPLLKEPFSVFFN